MVPLISIIVPNYNHAGYLKQRMDSILDQTFQDFEVIILDDSSLDNSWELLLSYATHPKVSHCIRNEINSGSPFNQWKKGIELAIGVWIWIAESDDYADKNFLSKAVSHIKHDVSLIYCKSVIVNKASVPVELGDWLEAIDVKRWNQDHVNAGLNEIKEYLIYCNIFRNASSVIFRKPTEFPEVILDMKYAGDWYFWVYILQTGTVSFISEYLNFFRSHNESTRALSNSKAENKRYSEYFMVIKYARRMSGLGSLLLFDFAAYDWLIKDIIGRAKRFGRLSDFALNPPIPISLRIPYYLQWFRTLFK